MKRLFVINLLGFLTFLIFWGPNFQKFRIETNMAVNYWDRNVAITRDSPKIQEVSLKSQNISELLVQTRPTGGKNCEATFSVVDGKTTLNGVLPSEKLDLDFAALVFPKNYVATNNSLTMILSSSEGCQGPLYFPSSKDKDILKFDTLNLTPVYYTKNPINLIFERISNNTGLTSTELFILTSCFVLMLILSCYFLAYVCKNLLGLKSGAFLLIIMWTLVWALTLFADRNKMIDYVCCKIPLTITSRLQ